MIISITFFHIKWTKALTYEWNLLGGLWLQVHAVLQPQQFGVGDAVSVAVQTGRDTRLLGLRFWIHQDDWRDWTAQRRREAERGEQERERENIITSCVMFVWNSWGLKEVGQLITHSHKDKEVWSEMTFHPSTTDFLCPTSEYGRVKKEDKRWHANNEMGFKECGMCVSRFPLHLLL